MIHRYIIEATDEVKGFEEAIERLDREWGIEELEPSEDAISRQAVLDYIYNDLGLGDEENGKDIERSMELDSSYRYIKSLPPVTPQHTEVGIQKMQEMEQAEIQKAYELGKEDKIKVLDKIRAEMIDLERRTMNDTRANGIWACVDIIDKFRAESED